MAEYIEREAIEYPYMTMTLWGLNNATCKAYNEGVKAAADAIAAIPAADVVEVVRCRDCKHWKKQDFMAGKDRYHLEYGGFCPNGSFARYESDFCSYGERRADNATD